MPWTVYLLSSRTRTYVGITTDLARRLAQHNGRVRGGAKATRAARPWRVAARFGPFDTRGAALRLEHLLKRLRRRARLELAMARGGPRHVAVPPREALTAAGVTPSRGAHSPADRGRRR
jgi:predicted GIY-YIG superfamily endonuclease